MRVHLPSYLVPGTWLENVRAIEALEWVSGVELLFFAYDEDARRILDREAEGLAAFAGRFRFSLHLPDPLRPSDEELVERTAAFVESFVIHPPRSTGESRAWAALVEDWRSRYGRVFYLEYTGREAFGSAEAALGGMELCADSGRLLLDGEDPAVWIAGRGERVRELHLHGLAEGKDHAALRPGEPWLEALAASLAGFRGIVELEVFSLARAEESFRALASTLEAVPEARP